MGSGDSWSTFFRRMPWFLQYYMLLLPLAMSMVAVVDSGRRLPPIYWNSTNSMFQTSSENRINTNLGDTIDIICPKYPSHTSITDMEYYVIYMVNRTAYETCVINNTSKFRLLVNCSYPTFELPVTYTLLIKGFQSIPGNPDFKEGQKYYFITTSGGKSHQIDNQYQGACKWKNMRLVLSVCCGDEDKTPKPTTNKYDTPHTTLKTTPRPSTTPRPTTTPTTTTTSITTTTTPQKTTPRREPTRTDRIPGDRIPDVNVIHVKGPKNVGLISDNAGHRTLLSMASLIVSVLLAHLLR